MDVEQDNVRPEGNASQRHARAGGRFEVYDIAQWFGEAFFETKKVVYAPR